ncbi:MAG: 2Fe-2S iron-sulfur cluster-binding protein [Geminicoccaceae bacterium]
MPWEKGRWALRCIGIFQETHDVKTFHFEHADDDVDKKTLFLHKPGQFITLRLQYGARPISRSYTIASTPSRPMTLALTIKRDPGGLVSRFMHDYLSVGDVISVLGPAGTFNSADIAPRSKLLMLSGGSGITPVMSMLRSIYDTASGAPDVVFLHSARTPADIIFRNELAWMEAGRLNISVLHICAEQAERDMAAGLLDSQILQKHAPDFQERTILTCGPKPYMSAVKTILKDADFDFGHYHEESFGDPSLRANPPDAAPENIQTVAHPTPSSNGCEEQSPDPNAIESSVESTNEVTFVKSDRRIPYRHGDSILEIATRAGIAIPTNCQMGLCGTCKMRLLSGEVDMDEDEGLADEDRDGGYVLTCCGRPKGPVAIDL